MNCNVITVSRFRNVIPQLSLAREDCSANDADASVDRGGKRYFVAETLPDSIGGIGRKCRPDSANTILEQSNHNYNHVVDERGCDTICSVCNVLRRLLPLQIFA